MPSEQRPLKVFLCHAHSDKNAVRDLYMRLIKDDVDAWLDKEKLLPGQDWELEIRKAVREADVVVVCLSKQFNQAGFRQKEVRLALDTAMEQPEGEIFIIPARLEECDSLESLRKWHLVDLFVEDGYQKLMEALQMRAKRIGAGNILKEPTSHISRPKLKTEYIVAIIGLVGTICAAIISLGGPILEKLLFPTVVSPVMVTSTIPVTPTINPWPTPTPYDGPLPTEITDEFGFQMEVVPAGEFLMGRDNAEYNERPLHKVYVEDFYIDKYEVTTAHYEMCVDKGICNPPSSKESFVPSSSYYGNPDYANYPVFYVDWNQAKTFCEWRGAQLPTEAQWEKAARGTDGRTDPWGEEIDCGNANYASCLRETFRVGGYEQGKSPYGIYDMAGNVWEWVDSWYDAYPGNLVPDLDYGTKYRVVRGGSYSDVDGVRSSSRDYYSPSTSSLVIGFRCAKDANP